MSTASPVSYGEGSWTDLASKRSLSYRVWQPQRPSALVVVLHGFGEHSGRYAPLAASLAEQGLSVAAPDLWGHGRSVGKRGDLADLARCASQLVRLTAQVFQPQSGSSRVVVFGHSFGALVAIMWALNEPLTLTRLIVQSPLLEVGFPLPPWKTVAARVLARCWPTYTFAMDLDATRLSHDPAVVRAYRDDPLVHNAMSARAYQAILRAKEDVFARAETLQIPVLLLCGTADRIISVEAARRWVALVRCEKRHVDFPDAYHELHHEAVKSDVVQLIREWTLTG